MRVEGRAGGSKPSKGTGREREIYLECMASMTTGACSVESDANGSGDRASCRPLLARGMPRGKLGLLQLLLRPTSHLTTSLPPSPLFSAVKVTFQPEEETVEFDLPSELSKGETTVHIEYSGMLNDQMRGFYRSKYTHPDFPGEDRFAAVTQFEVGHVTRGIVM